MNLNELRKMILMEKTYRIIGSMIAYAYDDIIGAGAYDDDVNWLEEIPDLIEYVVEMFYDKYDWKGYSLISTKSIIALIDHDKLIPYIESAIYDVQLKFMFDDHDLLDYSHSVAIDNHWYSNDKLDIWWFNYMENV